MAANKDLLIQEKKSALKYADAFSFVGGIVGKEGVMTKAGTGSEQPDGSIKNTTVINSCYYLDSHGDVHIPGMWNKSLSDNQKRPVNQIMLLQEHMMKFDKVIADKGNVVPYATKMSWRQLGLDIDGETEVLAFDNTITPLRNPYMYSQYKDGNVFNHSVGMQYVNIDLAINTGEKDLKKYKENWDKYIDYIANKDEAEEEGIFWAVTEAKVIEGSAVLRGSNIITPTLNSKNTLTEPDASTSKEPIDKSIFSTINQIFK